MKKKRRLSKAIAKLPFLAAAAGMGLLVHGCTEAEAEPKPDPQEVQRFLAELEERERLVAGEAERKKGYEKRIRNLVEGATVRAPSDAALNRLESSLVGSLSS